ncbi:MAG TPA: hypothetical protein VF575_05400 [Candidatus Saccharimonadales bacterium]
MLTILVRSPTDTAHILPRREVKIMAYFFLLLIVTAAVAASIVANKKRRGTIAVAFVGIAVGCAHTAGRVSTSLF